MQQQTEELLQPGLAYVRGLDQGEGEEEDEEEGGGGRGQIRDALISLTSIIMLSHRVERVLLCKPFPGPRAPWS